MAKIINLKIENTCTIALDSSYTVKNNIFNNIFPITTLLKYKTTYENLIKKLNGNFYKNLIIAFPLYGSVSNNFKIDGQHFNQDIKSSAINNLLTDFIKKHKIKLLTEYPFENYKCLIYYNALNSYNLFKKNDTVLLICDNDTSIDIIIYYQKFVNYNQDFNNIHVIIPSDKYAYRLSENNIKYEILEKVNTTTLKKNDFLYLDFNFVLKDLYYARNNYGFQTLLSNFIIGIQTLNIHGDILMTVPQMTNRLLFDFLLYVGQYFDDAFIHESEFSYHEYHLNVIIFKNYNGEINVDKLIKINKQNYIYDPSGGYNFQMKNESELKLLKIVQKSSNPPNYYLNKIVTIDKNNKCDKIYEKYCQKMKNIIGNKIEILFDINNIELNQINIQQRIQENITYSISYLKSINLNIPDWIDADQYQKLFINTAIRYLMFDTTPFIKQFISKNKNFNMVLSHELNYTNSEHTENLKILSESVYKYIEKINKKKYKSIELFINFNHKKMQKYLFKMHNITINHNNISRAWIKIFEVYDSIGYFKNIINNTKNENITAFHICEAPGNFVNSSIYYVKNKLKKKYVWNGQSLVKGLPDQYNFMKQTRDKWDYGCDKSGDITRYNNLVYYFKKYKNVDSLVGDCGTGWSASSSRDILGISQMIYAILLPRIGGNFVIKTFALNFSVQFISLINAAINIFEKVYVFRSSRNIWSPEMYIVGINKLKLNEKQEQIFLDIAKSLDTSNNSDNKILYPTNYMPLEVGLEFEHYTQQIIDKFARIKKMFVYFSYNTDIYEKYKIGIEHALDQKNIRWLDRHMSDVITDVTTGYRNYYNIIK
jgi:hypothetical protein